jgi:outer membrane protein assembly factor BamB
MPAEGRVGAGAEADVRGSIAWRFVTGGPVRTAPAAGHDGILYAVSDERRLYALYPCGRERWSIRLEARPAASPLLAYDGSVLLVLEDGSLLALGPNGRLRWRLDLPGPPASAPASGADGTLYVPVRGGILLALDPLGRERWRFQLRGEVSAAPSIGGDGTLYLGSADRRLLALRPSGEVSWELALPGPPGSPAVGRDGTLYVPAFGLHAVSPGGALLWSYAVAEEVSEPVILPDGAVAAAARSGRLLVVDPAGRLLWDRPQAGPGPGPPAAGGPPAPGPTAARPPAVAGSTAAAGPPRTAVHPPALASDGSLLAAGGTAVAAFSPAGGLRWQVQARREAGPPVPLEGGGACFGSRDWNLYGLRLPPPPGKASAPGGLPPEAARPPVAAAAPGDGLAASPWPQARHDGHHTGRFGALSDLDSPDYLALRELAGYPAEEAKLRALREAESCIGGERSGRVHAARLEALLGYLLSEGVTRREYERGRLANDYPGVRRQACRLLGELATAAAQALLVQAVRRDPDLTVKAAAARALAAVGTDTEEGLAAVLLAELDRHPREEALGLALLEALAAAEQGSPGALDAQSLQALLRASRGGHPREVRRRAEDLLRAAARRPRAAEDR